MELYKSLLDRRILFGSAWAFSGKVIFILSTITVNILLARILTPEAFGAYFLTVSLVTVSSVFAQQGLNLTVVRLVAESIANSELARANKSIRLVFLIGGGGSIVVALFLFAGAGNWLAKNAFNSTQMSNVIGYAAFWIVVTTFQSLLTETFRGLQDIRFATIFGGLVTSVLSAVLFFGLWIFKGHSGLEQVIMLSIVAGTTSTLAASFILLKKQKFIDGHCELPIQEVINITWPLWLTNLGFLAFSQADLWVIGIFLPQDDVAIYGAALRLVALVTIPLLIVNAVVPPFIAEMHTKGEKKELERILRSTSTIAVVPALIIFFIFVIFGKYILGTIYGSYYSEGAYVLSILSLGQIINVAAGSCGMVLMMTGHQTWMMYITFFSGLLIITGSITLVQEYQTFGVACVVSFGTALQNILMLLSVKSKIKLWTHIRIPLKLRNEKT
jgi:O-antigen/teichoic acid export membrane protein